MTSVPEIICRVRAIYPFVSNERASLSFQPDDEIDVLTQLESGWWDGWCNGRRGWFPCNYVQVIQEGALDQVEDLELVEEEILFQARQPQQQPQQQQPIHQRQQQRVPSRQQQERYRQSLASQSSQPFSRSETSPPQQMDHRLSFLAYPQQQEDDWRTTTTTNSSHSSSYYHQRLQQQQNLMQQQLFNDDLSDASQDEQLPKGWSLIVTDDGRSSYYYNHLTGGMRFKHPNLEDDSDQEEYDSDEPSYHQPPPPRPPLPFEERRIINADDLRRFSIASSDEETAPAEMEGGFNVPSPIADQSHDDENAVQKVLAAWVQRETPQGRPYFCNLITQDTTWDKSDIDPLTGRLISARKPNDEASQHSNGRETPSTPTPMANQLTSELVNSDDNASSVSSEPIDTLSWASLSSDIATAIHQLNGVAQQGHRDKLLECTSAVVETIRLMLYASGSMEKDASQLQDPALREPRRAIMSSLSKLVLSSKMATESSGAQSPEAIVKVLRDAGDVLSAVRNFVTTCQQCQVRIVSVSPHLIDDPSPALLKKDHHHELASKSNSGDASLTLQKAKYPLNQDLVVSLRTHANQIYGSTDALSTSVAFLLTLYRPSLERQEPSPPPEADLLDPAYMLSPTPSPSHYEDTEEENNAKANVIHLFRSLSGHLSQVLSILEDIDIPAMDLIERQIPSLVSFRTDKQALYNGVGRLFGKVQQLTDQQNERQHAVQQIDQAVENVERAMESILADVGEMVLQRHAWLIRQGETGKAVSDDSTIASTLCEDSETQHGPLSFHVGVQQDETNASLIDRRGTLASLGKHRQPKPSPEDRSAADWFLGPDYKPEELLFSADGNVKGGTLAALVERLTMHDSFDTSYIATFLLTYRSYCGTEEFISLLQDRYNLQPPDGLTPEQLEVWTETKQKLVRLRVFNVLKNWLENYYDEEDEFILGRLEFFTNTVIRDASPFSADQLNRLIRKRKEADSNQAGLKKMVAKPFTAPLPILPKNIMDIKLLETDPLEMARQLSLLDFKMYHVIRPIECLNKAWSRDIVKGGAPVAINVIQSIDYCNRLTSWVTDSILSPEEAKKRVVLIKYWAQVAEKCRNMNNYNTCMAIISAFDNSAIGRLRKTWELVGGRTSQVLAQIRKLMGANRNFTEYREMIHSVNPPCIPFLGIYLQDLTFIEDGNHDFLRQSDNLINFAKRQKCAEVIQEIKQFQSPPYTFHEVPQLQDFIKSHLNANHDVESLYERSLLLEPREAINPT
ncbi:ras GEF [Hesseltinella vesiculosa]|uniref:Ras GEF n=1 Tax=Hesseltinella vesiculosa TaxID=101127 RepID=A0A1X2GED8_9FUNG|nr:ras GEF [Hesseltinella vesiculosa]